MHHAASYGFYFVYSFQGGAVGSLSRYNREPHYREGGRTFKERHSPYNTTGDAGVSPADSSARTTYVRNACPGAQASPPALMRCRLELVKSSYQGSKRVKGLFAAFSSITMSAEHLTILFYCFTPFCPWDDMVSFHFIKGKLMVMSIRAGWIGTMVLLFFIDL